MPSWLPAQVKTVICGKLESELDRILKALEGVKSAMISDIESIENLLSAPGKVFQSIEDSMDSVNDMIQGLDSVVPDIHDLDSINSIILFLERCVYLKEHPLIKDAYKMAQQLLDEYQGIATEYIQTKIDYMNNNWPGKINIFDISDKLGSYKDKLNKFKVSQKQSDANDILICMNAICKLDEQDNPIQEVQDYIDLKTANLTSLQDQMRFTTEGALDVDKVLTNAGIDVDEKLIMNNTIDAVDHVKETFNEAQENLEAATGGKDIPHPATDLYTHYNEPTFYSTSSLFDQVDPTLTYSSEYLEKWNSLQLPVGTTYRKGMLDIKIEIDECTIIETPEPNINCFSTYTALVKIIIGFKDCTMTGDGATTTVTQINHGYSTGDIVIISDATNDILEGNHTITVTNDYEYTFSSTFNGSDEAKASSLFRSGEGEYNIGMAVCGTCGKYDRFGIGSASNEDLYYIRKHLSEAIKEAIETTMGLFTATEIEALIPNR